MKNVSEIYTLKSLANFLSYGAHHGEYLNSFVRYHSKHYDYFSPPDPSGGDDCPF